MQRRLFAAAAIAALLAAAPAFAHHSGAMFDSQKSVKAEGVVKELQWTNPHGWLQVMLPNPAGATEEWSLELTSHNILRRWSWTPTSLKPGDKVAVELNPLRDGKTGGRLVSVKLPDGKVLGGQGRVPAAGG